MSKFTVGDKIQRTSRPQQWAPLGFITTVEVGYTYTDADGVSGVIINSNDWSLAEGPVRTVTRREIVPGTYGRVLVDCVLGEGAVVAINDWHRPSTADELRSAAMILSQIAEALDDKEETK